MARKFFGTDGIRGRTNRAPMTPETALRVGQAAGTHFLRGDHRHRVVIGKDTRLSGYMMESAMVAGFTSVGMDVVLLGPRRARRLVQADARRSNAVASVASRRRPACPPRRHCPAPMGNQTSVGRWRASLAAPKLTKHDG